MVLDVSAALAWCFEDEADDASIALLSKVADSAVLVPSLWFIELGNALWQAERRKRIRADEIAEFLDLLDGLEIETDDAHDLRAIGTLLPLARLHKLTVYDAAYLDLAVRRSLPLATRDRALQSAAGAAGIERIGA